MQPKKAPRPAPVGAGIVQWPDGVAAATGLSAPTLQRRRSQGDAPKLYAVTERALVTTEADLLEWITAKAVPADYKCRPATVARGTKHPRNRRASQVGGEPGTVVL
jgi:predicted DNA-binding transcriptional regulator AlpA